MSVTYREFDVGKDSDIDAAIELIKMIDDAPVSRTDFRHNVKTWPKSQPVRRLVAEHDGKVVAFSRFGKYADNPKNAFMASFIVDREHKRNGIGTELLNRGTAYARENGAGRLCTYVKDGSAPT